MEENKRGMSPILIVVLSIIGTCLVAILVFMGVKKFIGGETDNQIEGPSTINVIENQEENSNISNPSTTTNENSNTSTNKPSTVVEDNSKYNAERYIVLSSKKSKFNYKKLNYGEIYVLYNGDFKKNNETNLRESYKVLKDSKGNDLYVKGVFAKNDFSNPIYFWGEDDYIYYFPNGYSKTNVVAAKYSEKKVKSISYDGECYIKIEYVDGTTDNTINTERDYNNMVELNLNNPDSLYVTPNSKVDYNYKYNLIDYGLEKVEVANHYNIYLASDKQNRSIRSEGYITSALGFMDCAGNIRLFYLTIDKKLYYVDLVSDDSEVFVAYLIDTNVEKIGKRLDIEDSTCGTVNMIGYKKVGSTAEYNINKSVISK